MAKLLEKSGVTGPEARRKVTPEDVAQATFNENTFVILLKIHWNKSIVQKDDKVLQSLQSIK